MQPRHSPVGLSILLVLSLYVACVATDEEPADHERGSAIYGGEAIAITEAPWQAMLVMKGENNPFCGAAVLGASWVITAQHCIDYLAEDLIQVRAGIARWDSAGGQRRNVRAFVRYPGFDAAHFGEDIALLLLDQPLTLDNSTVRAIGLIQDDAGQVGQTASVSGWGYQQDGTYPVALQRVSVPVTGLDGDQLEAGDATHDSCVGDSGGPLWTGSGASARLLGLVSWGTDGLCAIPGDPGKYARIAFFKNWIAQQMQRIWISECGVPGGSSCGGLTRVIGTGGSCDEATGNAIANAPYLCGPEWCHCSTSNGYRDVSSCSAHVDRCYLTAFGAATDGNNPALWEYACAGAGDVAPGTLDGKCHTCNGSGWSQTTCPAGMSTMQLSSCGATNYCFVTTWGAATDGNNGIIVPTNCAAVGATKKGTDDIKRFTCCDIGGTSAWRAGSSC